MALIIEAVDRAGTVERTRAGDGRTTVDAQPGFRYRVLDESGEPLHVNATVRRVGDHLVIADLPADASVELTDFFFVCTPDDPCWLSLDGIGGTEGEVIDPLSQPLAAMADGSFLLHSSDTTEVPVAPESEFSFRPALAGVALLAAAGAGGGGGGGGSGGPPPLSPDETTVTSQKVTNDPTPTITGTGVPGTAITVTLEIPGAGPVTFNTAVDGNGNWKVDTGTSTPSAGAMPPAGLPLDAPTTVRVLAAGTPEPIVYDLEMDLVPPPPPQIEPVTGDNVINADEARVANPSPITVEGTAEAGATVTVTWHGTPQSATADANGRWSVEFDGQKIPDGSYALSAVATDLAGNIGEPATIAVSVATNRPSVPDISTVAGADAILNDQEALALGTTGITGTTTAGTQVFVSLPGIFNDRPATVNGQNWSLTLSPAEIAQLQDGGSYQISAYARDGVNQSVTGTSDAFGVDRTPPAPPSITLASDTGASNADGITNNGKIQVDGLEPGATWEYRTSGSAGWTAGTGSSFELGAGTYAANAIQVRQTDAAGNQGAPAALAQAVTVDTSAPTPVISDDTTANTTNAPVIFTFDFGEAVTGFTANDITVSGGSKEAFTGADGASSYTLVVRPDADATGTITVDVPANAAQDLAGNPSNAAAQATQGFDTERPAVQISHDGGSMATGPVTFTFTFSEPVSGFAAADVSVSGGTKDAFNGAGDGKTYTLVVMPTGTAGTVSINVPEGAASDPAGNSNVASPTTTVDFAIPQPELTITDNFNTTPDITNDEVVFTFAFTQPVHGFEASDIQITGGTKGAFTGDDGASSYTLSVTPAPNTQAGQIEVSVAAGAAQNAASVGNPGPVTHSQAYDTKAPGLTITDDFAGTTTAAPVTFTFSFDEPVSGFAASDIQVTGGTASGFSSSGSTTYSALVTPDSGDAGTITVSVANGAATDAAGNGNIAAQATQGFDTRTISISEILDDAGPVIGPVANGGTADDPTPTIVIQLTGNLQAGETIQVHRNGGAAGVAAPDGSGGYTLTDDVSAIGGGGPFAYTAHVYAGGSAIMNSDPFTYTYSSSP